MARPKTEDLQKHTLNLRRGDLAAIKALYPKHDASVMLRRIVSKFVDQVQKVPENDVKVSDINL